MSIYEGTIIFNTQVTETNYTEYDSQFYLACVSADCGMISDCMPHAGTEVVKGEMLLTLMGVAGCMTKPKCRFHPDYRPSR